MGYASWRFGFRRNAKRDSARDRKQRMHDQLGVERYRNDFDSGVVQQPAVGNAPVTLTATISSHDVSDTARSR